MRLLSIVSTLSFGIFISFMSSEIGLSFFFQCNSISSNFLLMNLIGSLTSSMCLAPNIWASSLRKKVERKSHIPFFSKFCKQLFKILAQPEDSISSSKIPVKSSVFFLSSSSFYLLLKSRFCLSKNILIVKLIFKVSFKYKSKIICYFSTYFI